MISDSSQLDVGRAPGLSNRGETNGQVDSSGKDALNAGCGPRESFSDPARAVQMDTHSPSALKLGTS